MVLTPELLLRRAGGRAGSDPLPVNFRWRSPWGRLVGSQPRRRRRGGLAVVAMAPVGRRAAGKSHEGARIGGDVGSSYCPSRRVWFWRWIVRLETRSQR